jgi:hypothetical protein
VESTNDIFCTFSAQILEDENFEDILLQEDYGDIRDCIV